MAKEPLIVELTDARVKAGREYLDALENLGFRPDYAAWVDVPEYFDEQIHGRLQLALISPIVDRVGPKQIYDLLYRAYDAAATPKEIDPFDVALFSPECRPGYELAKRLRQGVVQTNERGIVFREEDGWVMALEPKGIYISGPRVKRTSDAQLRAFDRFKGKVMALAA